ncbi:hypothetical protein RHGRI_037179 [Rhododendron griersonianum]|uniref:ARM repeat superfamily protein n=1 Tax=Rhododendron griersonianum TaxID=479676 RepID=A0AAV6HW80_9ERIC|nr:hypothetical protein RHGRI_037179 [Rhododendron griersonianum]
MVMCHGLYLDQFLLGTTGFLHFGYSIVVLFVLVVSTAAIHLDLLSHFGCQHAVEGIKFICNVLVQATNNPKDYVMDDIVKDADRLVSCLANKVAKTFDFSIGGASSRHFKINADAVKESTLNSLVTEILLLLLLLDERVPRMDDGSQLLKALNVLMLKILDNAERTPLFVVLINLLRPWTPRGGHHRRQKSPWLTKFLDLVVKCLIKLTKVSFIFDYFFWPSVRWRILNLTSCNLEDLILKEGPEMCDRDHNILGVESHNIIGENYVEMKQKL